MKEADRSTQTHTYTNTQVWPGWLPNTEPSSTPPLSPAAFPSSSTSNNNNNTPPAPETSDASEAHQRASPPAQGSIPGLVKGGDSTTTGAGAHAAGAAPTGAAKQAPGLRLLLGKTLALLAGQQPYQQQQQQQHRPLGRLPDSALQDVQLSDVESVSAAEGFFGRLLQQPLDANHTRPEALHDMCSHWHGVQKRSPLTSMKAGCGCGLHHTQSVPLCTELAHRLAG
eukprot:1159719-Pelagomonas_calceolata.AAC.6